MKHWVYNLPPGGQGSLPYQYLATTGTCRQTDWGSRALNRAYNFNIFGALNRVSSSTWSIQYGANLGGTVRVYICGQWCVYKKKTHWTQTEETMENFLNRVLRLGLKKRSFVLNMVVKWTETGHCLYDWFDLFDEIYVNSKYTKAMTGWICSIAIANEWL